MPRRPQCWSCWRIKQRTAATIGSNWCLGVALTRQVNQVSAGWAAPLSTVSVTHIDGSVLILYLLLHLKDPPPCNFLPPESFILQVWRRSLNSSSPLLSTRRCPRKPRNSRVEGRRRSRRELIRTCPTPWRACPLTNRRVASANQSTPSVSPPATQTRPWWNRASCVTSEKGSVPPASVWVHHIIHFSRFLFKQTDKGIRPSVLAHLAHLTRHFRVDRPPTCPFSLLQRHSA